MNYVLKVQQMKNMVFEFHCLTLSLHSSLELMWCHSEQKLRSLVAHSSLDEMIRAV